MMSCATSSAVAIDEGPLTDDEACAYRGEKADGVRDLRRRSEATGGDGREVGAEIHI